MGDVARFSQSRWTPQDDLLLKNAVEAGASLQSLAKGAVKFSRRFTLGEIEDRWYSLLYDPVISSQASACMVNFMLSASPLPSNFTDFAHSRPANSASPKRKSRTISNSYYAMRKRIFDDTFSALVSNFLAQPENSKYTGVENIPKQEPQILGDMNAGFGELGGSNELAVDSLIGHEDNGMPLSISDPISNEPGNLCPELQGKHVLDSSDLECGMSFNKLQFSPHPEIPSWRTDNSIQEKPYMSCDNARGSIACGDAYIAQLSNPLFNITDEEEIYLMDANIRDEFDQYDYEAISSLLLDSPNKVSSDQITEIPETQASMTSNASVTNLSVLFQAEVDNNTGPCSSDGGLVHKSEVQMPSSDLAKDPRFPELINGVICCTVNTEDPEIPSNDDVVLPFDVLLSPVSHSFRWNIQEVNKPVSSSVEDLGYSHRTIEGYSLAKHSSYEKQSHDSSSSRNDADTNASGIQDHQMLRAEEGSSPTLDQEEQLLESDDDVPYYSDVEAMILDMDLDPDDQSWYYTEEVLRYGHDNTKRAIMRLEQVAHSKMGRDISLHGAFAVLYGRCSRHYIKKTEVLLGRATQDIVVDIDLSKERAASKISRRQAIIKMDKVGSFYLKNLGKYRILINDKQVHPGQYQILHSSCLIEIRGMPYIFVTNQSRVKKYLHDITQNNQTQ